VSYTFNADDAQGIPSLSVTVSGLSGMETCFDNGSPLCSSIDSGATGNCIHVNGHTYNCPVAPAALSVTLSRNMVVIATGTINPDGSFTLGTDSLPVTFNAGDTLTLKVMNPSSSVTDTITSGTWTL
jgi:hypothetical protein